MTPIRVVSPYRPFAPESAAHRKLGAFDWIHACCLMAITVRRVHDCPIHVITDVDTDLPVRALHYQTTHRRLMLWILEVSLRYLESDDFDRDTVMLSPDVLVQGSLMGGFHGDLGLLIRPGVAYEKRPILNAAQWWSVAAKSRLVQLYERLLAVALTLPEPILRWGADTEPFRLLLRPLHVGVQRHHDLEVYGMDRRLVMDSLSPRIMRALEAGQPFNRPVVPIIDFKGRRKHYMGRYWDALCREQVAA